MPAPNASLREPTTSKQRDRRQRILRAARQAFAQNPFHKVLMEDVAADAAVGKGTVYRYFPDKESLYFAVIFGGLQELQDQIRATPADPEDMVASIRGLVKTLVTFFTRNRTFFHLMNQEDSRSGSEHPNRQRWRAERMKLIDAIAVVLERGRQNGVLEVRNPRVEAQILQGMVRSVLVHGNVDTEAVTGDIARIFLHGVALPGGEKQPKGAAGLQGTRLHERD